MFKLSNLFKFTVILAAMALIGCSERPNMVQPEIPNAGLNPLALPGVTIDSAVFSIYLGVADNQVINVHRITVPWAESLVTWDNFGAAFDPTIEGSFLADTPGWKSVNVTSLVVSWLDGINPNNGLLIETDGTGAEIYGSSEYADVNFRPFLTICYTTDEGSNCITIRRTPEGDYYDVVDSYIWALYPTTRDGWADRLYTGFFNGYEKQSLLKFKMPTFEIPELAAIGDLVWNDTNMNGIQDNGEAGVAGVTVNLMDCGATLLATMQTDANGNYLFSGLQPGDYNVQFVLPDGYNFSPQDQGSDDAVDSDADVTTGNAICTNLIGGETDLTWDAGIFMMPDEPGCTYTIGFWKNHAGFRRQADLVSQYLPIWLGTPDGEKSRFVDTARKAVDYLGQQTYGSPYNGITKLYAQLLGAKLNIANGADGSEIMSAIAEADAFLASHDWRDWYDLTWGERSRILELKDTFDDYNNGRIGPGHCDDDRCDGNGCNRHGGHRHGRHGGGSGC